MCLLFTLLSITFAIALAWAPPQARVGPQPTTEARRGAPDPRPAPTYSPAPQPGLAFDSEILDLGELSAGALRRVTVAWRRAGPGPLRVYGVAADCGCAAPDGLPPTLPEGAAGTLGIDVRAPARPGPFSTRVRVAAGRTRHVVRLTAYVGRPVAVRPERLDLGPRTGGRRVARTLEVSAAPIAATQELTLALEGLPGALYARPRARAGAGGWDVEVDLGVPRTPGPFTGAILLTVGTRPALRVPVAGRVVASVRK